MKDDLKTQLKVTIWMALIPFLLVLLPGGQLFCHLGFLLLVGIVARPVLREEMIMFPLVPLGIYSLFIITIPLTHCSSMPENPYGWFLFVCFTVTGLSTLIFLLQSKSTTQLFMKMILFSFIAGLANQLISFEILFPLGFNAQPTSIILIISSILVFSILGISMKVIAHFFNRRALS